MKRGIAKHDIMRHCTKQTEIYKGDVVDILRTDMHGSDLLIRKAGTYGRTLVVFPEYIQEIENENQDTL